MCEIPVALRSDSASLTENCGIVEHCSVVEMNIIHSGAIPQYTHRQRLAGDRTEGGIQIRISSLSDLI